MISYYYNGMTDQSYQTLDKLIAIEPEPSETLANRVNYVTERMDLFYYPNDEFL